jgi:hypothetical protein
MAQHPAVIRAQALVHSGDIAAAESALSALVETEGDHALVAVLDELPPKDLIAILREYDAARPSVISLVVTPAQFAEAVILERKYAERDHERLRGMINAVVFREDADPDEYVAALAEKDLGLEVLADYLADRYEAIDTFVATGRFDGEEDERPPRDEEDDQERDGGGFSVPRGGSTLDEVRDGDWMELTWRLAHHHPDEFFHVYKSLTARARLAPAVETKAEGEEAAPAAAAPKAPPAEESAL